MLLYHFLARTVTKTIVLGKKAAAIIIEREPQTREKIKMMSPFINILYICLDIYYWMILIQIIMSWLINFNIINTHQQLVGTVVEFLYQITTPFYSKIRRFLPVFGNVDLTPLACLLIIHFAKMLLISTIAPLLGVK